MDDHPQRGAPPGHDPAPPALSAGGLGRAFRARALAVPDRVALLDSRGAACTYREACERALALAQALERRLAPAALEPRVGVILPPGIDGALVNLALGLGPRTSVNLNAVAGPAALREQIARAGLRTVILPGELHAALGGAALFEDRALPLAELEASITAEERALAGAAARTAPGAEAPEALETSAADAGRIATVLFSSGSTARAKAIQLTHAGVLANARAVAQAFELAADDRLFGILPFFHSFGFTVTLWAPLVAGASVVFHADPLDARAVGEAAAEHRPTILVATPALCQAWIRRIEPAQLASVRLTVVGAQRLPPTLEAAWHARYGGHLYEGYGCTELAPVVSVNLPDAPGRVRRKPGSVGRPIPGVAVEIRAPGNGPRLPAEAEGDVWVRSPGAMAGYLGDPEATRAALVDGWYDTQDVGRLDAGGFLTLTDRRSRFTKIGGEMISHGAVESALSAAAVALGEDPKGLALAVTSLPDEQRGERLCALHTPVAGGFSAVLERARADGLPNLFTPRAADCFEVAALPYLGSGKLDLARLKQLAAERRGALAKSGD